VAMARKKGKWGKGNEGSSFPLGFWILKHVADDRIIFWAKPGPGRVKKKMFLPI
jgi:hypothetical protein